MSPKKGLPQESCPQPLFWGVKNAVFGAFLRGAPYTHRPPANTPQGGIFLKEGPPLFKGLLREFLAPGLGPFPKNPPKWGIPSPVSYKTFST